MSNDDRQVALFYAMQLRNFGSRMAELITYDHMVDQKLVPLRDKPYAPVYTEINDAWRDLVALVEYLGEEAPWKGLVDARVNAARLHRNDEITALNVSIRDLERRAKESRDWHDLQETVIIAQFEALDGMINLLIGQDLTHKERDGQLKLLREYAKRDMYEAVLHPDGVPF
jgi:hypothetical protein